DRGRHPAGPRLAELVSHAAPRPAECGAATTRGRAATHGVPALLAGTDLPGCEEARVRAARARPGAPADGRYAALMATRALPAARTSGRRLVATLAVLILGLTAILTRLVLLQVKDASAFDTLAHDQRVRDVPAPAPRGSILDRNGQPLAISVPAKAVFADPKLVTDPKGEAQTIAATLGLDQANVLKALTGTGRFVYLDRGVDVSIGEALQSMLLPGVGLLDERRRSYPDGPIAPQVVGFVGVDDTGLAGLELGYQSLLGGRAGRQVIEEDPSGTVIPQGANIDQPPVPGDDLVLTLDQQIQFRAQQALAQPDRP